MPINILTQWLEDEKQLGAPNPQQAVLATATLEGIPHCRVVAIREISNNGLVFFSQRCTRKVQELTTNLHASMTFWFELKQREVIIEGYVKALSTSENEFYWNSQPRERQLRFTTYAPISGQVIESIQLLETKEQQLAVEYQTAPIPMSTEYCGFRIIPQRFCFYTLGSTTFSEVMEYRYQDDEWLLQQLSP